MRIVLKLFLILILPLLLLITDIRKNTAPTSENSSKILLNDLCNGDVIFRRGRSVESYAVLLADKNREYSHVGIIWIENREQFVIHAVPGENNEEAEYIKKEKIAGFLSKEKASKFAVYRPYLSAQTNEKAAKNALNYYNNHYTFDGQYDLNTDNKLYCTELIIKAFGQVDSQLHNFNSTSLNFLFSTKKIILPSNIIEHPFFLKSLIIKN